MAATPLQSKLHQWLAAHPLWAFLLMTLAFLVFGLLSLDLVRVVSANAGYLLDHGWTALKDNGLRQALELGLTALAAILAYLVFKLCEYVLVQKLLHRG
jgi:ABC-type sulfate transport system permease component